MEDMERVAEEIHRELDSLNDAEVTSRQLGKLVMERLRTLDPVAYVRYASVYRQFQEVGDFIDEIQSLERRIADSPDQTVLFKS
jgi:transcriptional repressor NrdR